MTPPCLAGRTINIVDVGGVSMGDATGEAFRVIARAGNLLNLHFPDRLHTAFVVNAPGYVAGKLSDFGGRGCQGRISGVLASYCPALCGFSCGETCRCFCGRLAIVWLTYTELAAAWPTVRPRGVAPECLLTGVFDK